MADLPTSSIDMILCDLPYGTTANAWDKVIPFEYLWGQYERLIKPQGAIVLTATERFSADLVQSNPALYRYKWVWIKNTVTNFVNAKNRPLSRFEEILVFSKAGTANFGNSPDTKGMNYFPQGLLPYNKTVNSRKYENSNQLHPRNAPDTYTQEWTNYPSDVLNYKSDRTGWHPTQKPVDLFAYLIKTYTQPGEIVLDNCMGSGTTAIATMDTDRHFIGYEISEEYWRRALDHIKHHHATQTELF